jgi:predicted O-linked N-acetylglucosamine transferase (SPINDLY family)
MTEWARFADYLDLICSFDIALDTFPFTGGTTTAQQLYLGVPCVTLAGERQVSRMGVTMLHAVGLDDLIATTIDEYFEKVIALANDLPRLSHIRATLRDRMLATTLADAHQFTRQLESAYRNIWRNWCLTAGARA